MKNEAPVKVHADKNGYSFFNQDGEKIAFLSTELKAQGIFNDNFYGYIEAKELKFIMANYYAKIISEIGATKKICNIKAMEGSAFDTISEWFEQELVPTLIKAGLRYNALVLPSEFFASLAIENAYDDMEDTDTLN